MKRRKTHIYKIYAPSKKSNNNKCIIDVSKRAKITIIENCDLDKNKLANETFDKNFYNEINEKINLLSNTD